MNTLITNVQYLYIHTILILQTDTVSKDQFCEALFDGKLDLLIMFIMFYWLLIIYKYFKVLQVK